MAFGRQMQVNLVSIHTLGKIHDLKFMKVILCGLWYFKCEEIAIHFSYNYTKNVNKDFTTEKLFINLIFKRLTF